MNYPSKFSVGIVGAGQIVETNHAPLLKANGNEVFWVIDINYAKAKTLASFLNCTAFSDIEELKQAKEPDIILIACPYGARFQYYSILETYFLESALLIEKPLALTMKDHLTIEKLRYDYKIGALYTRRASSSVNEVKKILAHNYFGPIRSCYIGWGNISMITAGRYVSNIKIAGGGTLFDNAIHDIDALNFILDAQDITVRSSKMLFDDEIEIHTDANYLIKSKFGDNIPCHLVVTHLKDVVQGIILTFDFCTLSFSVFGGEIIISSLDKSDSTMHILPNSAEYKNREYELPYLKLWELFNDGIQKKQVNYTSLSTSRLTTKIIEMVYKMGGREL